MEVVLTSLSGGLCLNVSFELHLLLKFWLLLPCLMLLGVFEMSHSGLQADSNASEMFLSEQLLDSEILVGLAVVVVMDGSWTFLMEIQIDESMSVIAGSYGYIAPEYRAALPIIRPSLGRQHSIANSANRDMQGYLNHFLGNISIVNSREVHGCSLVTT